MKNPISATITGLWQMRQASETVPPLRDEERLDGRTAIVTGANRGLGRAVSIDLARRGARVLLACRSGIPEAGQHVARASGRTDVETRHLDLADLASIERFADDLARGGTAADVLVLNAGIVPRDARPTSQGLELMFGVNYLANVALVEALLDRRVLVPSPERPPRIVFVTSETHRGAGPVDFTTFGEFRSFGPMTGVKVYGYSKLLLSVYASQLARRLGAAASVHACCPGAVNTDIAREAPSWMKPILAPVMGWFFRSPEDAAAPVVYLSCATALEHSTGTYLHVLTPKPPDDECLREEVGARLEQASLSLIASLMPQERQELESQG